MGSNPIAIANLEIANIMCIFVQKILMKTKKCTKCALEKPLEQFQRDRQKKSGRRPDCATCSTKKSIQWQKNNPEKVLNNQMKWKHGITLLDYNNKLKIQNYCCAICGKSEKDFKDRLHIDHNHKTGKIRSLLCVNCNHGIGAFMENKDLLMKAKKYLEIWD